jgi:Mg-chelatase subunit ChlD
VLRETIQLYGYNVKIYFRSFIICGSLARSVLRAIIIFMGLESKLIFILLLLPVAALLVWLALSTGWSASWKSILLRGVIALLLAASAAGFFWTAGDAPGALVILDRSASLGSKAASVRLEALAAGRALGSRFNVSYASIASSMRAETAEGLADVLSDPVGSDLGLALRAARKRMKAGQPVVLLSDGQATVSGVRSEILNWSGASAPKLVIIPLGPAPGDVGVRALLAPAQVRPGGQLQITAVLNGSGSGPLSVELQRIAAGGQVRPIDSRILLAPEAGSWQMTVRFSDQAPQNGLLEYRLKVGRRGDPEAGNNSAGAFVRVTGSVRSKLITARPTGKLVKLLLRAAPGLKVISPAADLVAAAVFRDCDVLILDDLADADLPGNLRGPIVNFVKRGGGLLVLGGNDSYAAGGYTDGGVLERALPVSMIPPDDGGLLAVLLLDCSGSMGQAAAGESSKLAMVSKAVTGLLDPEFFSPADRMAIITFSAQARTLAGPFAPAQVRECARAQEAVAGLRSAGSTDLVAALRRAREVLAAAAPPGAERRGPKHIVLLSDGLPVGGSAQAQVGQLLKMAQTLVAEGVTLSTVGTGSRQEDTELLSSLARIGAGRYYRPADLSQLVAVFRRDLSQARSAIDPGSFRVLPGARSIVGLPQELPVMRGRNRVSLKKRAWSALEVAPAAGRGRESYLACWELEGGRVACLAGSPGGQKKSISAADAVLVRGLLKSMVDWAAARSLRKGFSLSLEPQTDKAGLCGSGLALVMRLAPGTEIPRRPVVRINDHRESRELLQNGPFSFSCPVSFPGQQLRLRALVEQGDSGAELVRAVFARPVSPELMNIGINNSLLDSLVQTSGGVKISSAAALAAMEFSGISQDGRIPLVDWFAAGALLLLLCELLLRILRR